MNTPEEYGDFSPNVRDLTAEPMFPIEFDDVEPLQSFSIEHWMVLYAQGVAPAPPLALAPFPPQIHPESQLLDDMARWGLYDGSSLDKDLAFILDSLTGNYTHGVAGTLTLPQRGHERTLVLHGNLASDGAEETMVMHEQPTYPFLMVKNFQDVIVTAMSTEVGMTFNVTTLTANNYAEQFAEELIHMIDAEGTWSPAPIKRMHVPAELGMDTRVPLMFDEDKDIALKARRSIKSAYLIQDDTLAGLESLLGYKQLAAVSFTPLIRLKDDSIYAHSEGSGQWVLASRDEHAPVSYVTWPEAGSNKKLTTGYAPYSAESLRSAMTCAFQSTAFIVRERGADDVTNPWYFMRYGAERAAHEGVGVSAEQLWAPAPPLDK